MNAQDPKDQTRPLQESEPNEERREDSIGEALTDDERVRREKPQEGDGARVTPGPADLERLPTA